MSDEEMDSLAGSAGYQRDQLIPKSWGHSPHHVLSFRNTDSRHHSITISSDTPLDGPGVRLNPNRMNSRKYSSASHSSRARTVEPESELSEDVESDTAPLLRDRTESSDSLPPTPSSRDISILEEIMDIRETTRPAPTFSGYMKSLHLWPLQRGQILDIIKIGLLISLTIMFCAMMLLQKEQEERVYYTVFGQEHLGLVNKEYCNEDESHLRLTFHGAFYSQNKDGENNTQVYIYLDDENIFNLTVNSHTLNAEEFIERKLDLNCIPGKYYNLTARSDVSMPVEWTIKKLHPLVKHEVIFAVIILVFVYVLIVFEIVHRTIAAELGALAALAALSCMNQRPDMKVIMSWIDIETLALLFGMMIIVSIFADTGFFDYFALRAYKLARGRVWPLITLLIIFCAIFSAFMENVTTILLMTPVTIRLCEVLNLDPKRILIAEVLFSNIGGTGTAMGEPPNVIIVGALSSQGIGFSEFTVHMLPGSLLIGLVGYGLLRFYCRDVNLQRKDPHEIAELKHQLSMWRRAADRVTALTREETLMKAILLQKALETEHFLNRAIHKNEQDEITSFTATILKLEKEYVIKNPVLLIKCAVVIVIVIIFLFTYSFIDGFHADIGWIAVLGSIWLLVLVDQPDFEGILHKVEWATLLFFAALFILTEALAELGLMSAIGDGLADVIGSANENSRLAVALVLILWVSALASSLIDNIPYTTAMVPVLQELADKPDLDLPLLPMYIALAFGACLGGNGTLIADSCNVVCAGIAEHHGYGFTFNDFFKIGFPMMVITTATATAYILICHCVLFWNV